MSRESIAGWRDRVVAMHKAEEVIIMARDCDFGDWRDDIEIFEASLWTVKVDEVAPILAGVYGRDIMIAALQRLPEDIPSETVAARELRIRENLQEAFRVESIRLMSQSRNPLKCSTTS